MSTFKLNSEMVFMALDLGRPRIAVEREKMHRFFPDFRFCGGDGYVNSVQGYLRTNYGNSYLVRVEIPSTYPYSCPSISLPQDTIDSDCPHKYSLDEICVMKSEQWSSNLSLAFMVAKAAVWLNKYDLWRYNGKIRWPGKDQHR